MKTYYQRLAKMFGERKQFGAIEPTVSFEEGEAKPAWYIIMDVEEGSNPARCDATAEPCKKSWSGCERVALCMQRSIFSPQIILEERCSLRQKNNKDEALAMIAN